MRIVVDADACPVPIREIIFRASKRTCIGALFVANHAIVVPRSATIEFKRVGSGFDQADNYIADTAIRGDIVITSDIPLASDCIAKGCVVLSHKGELMTCENIKERLNLRDFMDVMRGSGAHTGGSAPLSAVDIKRFSDGFDRELTKVLKFNQT